MKLRAKMIDGTLVTFESHDLGQQMLTILYSDGLAIRAGYVTEFVGEGLYVRSECCGGPEQRREADRLALEHGGVDTATVEVLEFSGDWWRPLWPNFWDGQTLRVPAPDENPGRDREDAEFLLGMRQTHAGYGQPTEAMIAAGAAGLHDILYSELIVEAGRVRLRDYRGTAILLYEAMEKARR